MSLFDAVTDLRNRLRDTAEENARLSQSVAEMEVENTELKKGLEWQESMVLKLNAANKERNSALASAAVLIEALKDISTCYTDVREGSPFKYGSVEAAVVARQALSSLPAQAAALLKVRDAAVRMRKFLASEPHLTWSLETSRGQEFWKAIDAIEAIARQEDAP